MEVINPKSVSDLINLILNDKFIYIKVNYLNIANKHETYQHLLASITVNFAEFLPWLYDNPELLLMFIFDKPREQVLYTL
jgi:hypothetical protein